jgi:hypothetical protein
MLDGLAFELKASSSKCIETHNNLNVRFSFQGPSGKCFSVEGADTLDSAPRTVNRKSLFFRFDSGPSD